MKTGYSVELFKKLIIRTAPILTAHSLSFVYIRRKIGHSLRIWFRSFYSPRAKQYCQCIAAQHFHGIEFSIAS